MPPTSPLPAVVHSIAETNTASPTDLLRPDLHHRNATTGSPARRRNRLAPRWCRECQGQSTRNMSAQSSMYFRTPMAYRGGFAAFARGDSGTQAFQGVPFSSSIQLVGQQFSSGQVMHLPPGSNYFSQGLGIQAAESSNIQPVMRNQFPTRFGISQADLLGTQQSGIPFKHFFSNIPSKVTFIQRH
nr:uncharacterized protein LOC109164549 isoform X2 [Ipomoea batatas]